jgi:uncharacterized protein
VIAELVPFKPNMVKLSNQIGISRETLLRYLYLLEKADLLLLLHSGTSGISQMNKPEKVYLKNPNLAYVLSHKFVNIGNVRETFLYNQLKVRHKVSYPASGDFQVDGKFTIEVGGKNKTKKQIAGIENGYVASDNIEYNTGNKIPLWLFGFLY